MHFKTVALLALAAVASTESLKFTHISPPQLGLIRRQGNGAYEPEETECGAGNTCAEACGAGFEQCDSKDGVNSCFNPSAGETCCKTIGLGTSCQAGFFCAHDQEESTVCCAEGTSLEECAALNGADGGLVSDAPAPTSTPEPTGPATTESSYETDLPSTGSNSTTAVPSASNDGSTPTSSPTDVPESGASGMVSAAALLVVGAVACLL